MNDNKAVLMNDPCVTFRSLKGLHQANVKFLLMELYTTNVIYIYTHYSFCHEIKCLRFWLMRVYRLIVIFIHNIFHILTIQNNYSLYSPLNSSQKKCIPSLSSSSSPLRSNCSKIFFQAWHTFGMTNTRYCSIWVISQRS